MTLPTSRRGGRLVLSQTFWIPSFAGKTEGMTSSLQGRNDGVRAVYSERIGLPLKLVSGCKGLCSTISPKSDDEE